MFKTITLFITLCLSVTLHAQSFLSKIPFLPEEKWWGAFVAKGSEMPYLQSIETFDLSKQGFNNQAVPLFISNKGRYIWSDEAFQFQIHATAIQLESKFEEIKVVVAGKTLRDAYLAACRSHFPPSGKLPDPLFFSLPQYNTWIELMYNQNQSDILNYADKIIQYDFPKGVFMIDDNWQKYYGNFDFKPDKFPDPKGMINQLHDQGFKIMLWVCPFVSADSPEFRDLQTKGYLLRQKGSDEPALIHWWNGYSACYDLTNPEAFDYFVALLKEVQQKYGVDGFKFDAGDALFYDPQKIDSYKPNTQSTDHTLAWAKIGLSFPFNEYRAGWRMGGEPLVQRLGDKDYSWNAVGLLIPDMIAAGLLGYPYVCPDMIGGGQFTSFLGIDSSTFNQNLIIRSTQVHALMPMMQFSVAPWRILSEENREICREMAYLHVKMGDYILECAKQASQTGEPIVRHLEYMFPEQGLADCKDQFMLGEKFLVAPVINSENQRTVVLPKGKWRDERGNVFNGGKTITVDAAINRLPYFEKIK
jgi:alpha-glucosidase